MNWYKPLKTLEQAKTYKRQNPEWARKNLVHNWNILGYKHEHVHIENTIKLICRFYKSWSSQGRMQVSAGNVFWRLSNVPLLHITCHHHLAPSISSPHSCLWIFNMNLTSSSLPSSPATVKTDIGRNFGQIFFIFFLFFSHWSLDFFP